MEQEYINYLAAHVVQALAEDRRSAVLGIEVEVIATRVYLMGQVETEARREAAELVARELVPEGWEVVNQLWVPSYERPAGPESLH